MGFGKLLNIAGNNLGQKIGEGYAKQGKSWDEISSMPSSGSGFMSDAISSGAKTGYDNYMSNNRSNSNTGSASNMIQSPGGSGSGLAASAVGTAQQPTFTPGVQNPAADSAQFGNRTNGLGVMVNSMGFSNGQQGLASSGINQPWSPYGVPNGTNEYSIMDGVKLI